jgi:metal-sulfur cluster biosynthetic enzyme
VSTVSSDYLVEQIRDALRVVIDPELGHNIVELGFVYDIAVDEGGVVTITMTTTTRGCPATGFLKQGAANSAWGVPGVEFVNVDLTYDPQWTPEMISLEAQAELGFTDGRN